MPRNGICAALSQRSRQVETIAVQRLHRTANGNGQVRSFASACAAIASRLAAMRVRIEASSAARAARAACP